MPLPLAGFDIDSHEAFTEQAGPGPIAAVIISSGQFDGKVHEAEIRIDRNLRPDAGVACIFGGSVEPGIITELALFRNGVKDPEALAGANVERADVAFVVCLAL